MPLAQVAGGLEKHPGNTREKGHFLLASFFPSRHTSRIFWPFDFLLSRGPKPSLTPSPFSHFDQPEQHCPAEREQDSPSAFESFPSAAPLPIPVAHSSYTPL